MLREGEVEVGPPVVGDKVVEGDMTGDPDLFEVVTADDLLNLRQVPFEASVLSGQYQAGVGVVILLVDREEAKEVIDLLVGDDAADEEKGELVILLRTGSLTGFRQSIDHNNV